MRDPGGLCRVRAEHLPHRVVTGSLAPYWCRADQAEREPARSERRRRERGAEPEPLEELQLPRLF
jgi:hypothetical protein